MAEAQNSSRPQHTFRPGLRNNGCKHTARHYVILSEILLVSGSLTGQERRED